MIYIGVGSNREPELNITAALRQLRNAGLPPSRLSTHYRTEPVKHKKNPAYINGVWQLDTEMSCGKVKTILNQIEEDRGRRRNSDPYASREIDLDILLCLRENRIHRDVLIRNFVYLPLLELDGNIKLPDGQDLYDLVNHNDTRGMSALNDFTGFLRSITG